MGEKAEGWIRGMMALWDGKADLKRGWPFCSWGSTCPQATDPHRPCTHPGTVPLALARGGFPFSWLFLTFLTFFPSCTGTNRCHFPHGDLRGGKRGSSCQRSRAAASLPAPPSALRHRGLITVSKGTAGFCAFSYQRFRSTSIGVACSLFADFSSCNSNCIHSQTPLDLLRFGQELSPFLFPPLPSSLA